MTSVKGKSWAMYQCRLSIEGGQLNALYKTSKPLQLYKSILNLAEVSTDINMISLPSWYRNLVKV